MFTRNYDNLKIYSSTGMRGSGIVMKDVDGNNVSFGTNEYDFMRTWGNYTPRQGVSGGNLLWIGTGTVSPTYDDYSNAYFVPDASLTALAHTDSGATYDENSGRYQRTITRRFVNISASDIVVTEIYAITITSARKGIMCHELLATPITVASGASLNISFTISVAAPTAP